MSNRSSGFVPTQHEPEVQIIKLHKSNNGMGLSIVAAKVSYHDLSIFTLFLSAWFILKFLVEHYRDTSIKWLKPFT